MVRETLLSVAFVGLLCTGCATSPEHPADVEYYAPKVYRTGSNIAVKDYGAANIDVFSPDVFDRANPRWRCAPGAGPIPGC